MDTLVLIALIGLGGTIVLFQVLFVVLVVPLAAKHGMVPGSLVIRWRVSEDLKGYRDLLAAEGRSTAPYVVLKGLQFAVYGFLLLFLYALLRDCGSDPDSDYEMIRSMGEERADDLVGE